MGHGGVGVLTKPGYDAMEEWSAAIEQLLEAARDSAEFAAGRPLGRSRTASLRRLAGAIERVDQLARSTAAALRSVAVPES